MIVTVRVRGSGFRIRKMAFDTEKLNSEPYILYSTLAQTASFAKSSFFSQV
jgi:hypothetical protein